MNNNTNSSKFDSLLDTYLENVKEKAKARVLINMENDLKSQMNKIKERITNNWPERPVYNCTITIDEYEPTDLIFLQQYYDCPIKVERWINMINMESDREYPHYVVTFGSKAHKP